jgi:hypothetical protein
MPASISIYQILLNPSDEPVPLRRYGTVLEYLSVSVEYIGCPLMLRYWEADGRLPLISSREVTKYTL